MNVINLQGGVEPVTLQQRVHGAPRPPTWHLDKLHRVLRVRRGIKNDGMKEDNLLSLSYGRIIPKDINSSEGLLPENFEGYQIVEPGNIVMRLTDLQNDKRSLRQGLVKERGIITSAYDALDVPKDQCPEFWFYSLLALDLAKHYYSLGGGVRQSVKFTDFPNDWIYLPDLTTQRQIADFLDRETARIDLLIEKKQRMVQLLAVREKAAVSFGLSRTMSDSGPKKSSKMPWVAEIPGGWFEQPLKQLAEVIDCKHTTPEYVDEGTPLISTGEVKSFSISFVSNRRVSDRDYRNMTEGGRKPKPDDIIYSRNASVGAACLVGDRPPFCMGQDICLIRPTGINPMFLEQQLNSDIVHQQLGSLLVGSTLKRVNVNDIKNFTILVPPLAEQVAIVDELNRSRARFLLLSETNLRSITRLREYRSALITAAVTGQIDPAIQARAGHTDRQLMQWKRAEHDRVYRSC